MTTTEITHFHLFCGAGGGALGFNRGEARVGNLSARFVCLGGVDSDAAAIRDFGRLAGVPGTVLDLFSREQYIAFHGHEPPAGRREATAQDLQRAAGFKRPLIVFLSAPCLPGKSEVLTPQGPRRIETLRAGDQVLTHRGRYRPILKVGTHQYTGEMVGVRLNGTVDVQEFTTEHPLWRRRVVRNEGTGRKRALGPAEFVRAAQVRVGDRIGFPVDQEETGVAARFIGDRLPPLSTHLWFLLGAYLGDGYRRHDRTEVIFCLGAADSAKAVAVRRALLALGLSWSEDRSAGAGNIKIRVSDQKLHPLAGAFGDGAENKRIPEALMRVEKPCMEALIAGYRITDGSEQGRRTPPGGNELQARWKIPSISLGLLRDLQRLLLRAGQYGRIHRCWAGGPQVIEGRTVQTRPRWELCVAEDAVKRTAHEFIDGAIWIRIREITLRPASEPVWNLEVAEDNTFCVHLMATHNCKGFSGLLSGVAAASAKYQALNELALRGLMLALAAWGDDPPPLFIFENVPRIAQRGRHLLDQIRGLLEGHGYAVAETAHDCGQIGGLAQHRRRFLLVARHKAKVPAFLYEPPKRRVLAIGEVLGTLLMPEHPAAGPMHRLPRLKWDTWVRLSLIPAGGDWRDLPRGKDSPVWRDNQQYGVVPWQEPAHTVTGQSAPGGGAYSVADPRWGGGGLGVADWQEPAGTVTGEAYPSTGRFSVADPRWHSDVMGVRAWDEPSGTVTGRAQTTTGAFSVADPRPGVSKSAYRNLYRVVRWEEASTTITGATRPAGGAQSVADPRLGQHANKMRVEPWDCPAHTVTGSDRVGSGAPSVADPRPWAGAGHYGVLPWDQPAGAVTASGGPDNGRGNVADPRGVAWVPPEDVPLIISLDNTWHRPLTTYELAALQGFPVGPDFDLDGASHTRWREAIGNAVPPPAAQAIAGVMGQVLLLAATGQTFALASTPIWVREVAIALGVDQ